MLLKKEAKVLADKLADSIFTTLADRLADSWRIDWRIGKNPMVTTTYSNHWLADKLADNWRGAIRQSATPFRVADRGGCWRIPAKKVHMRELAAARISRAQNITMLISEGLSK